MASAMARYGPSRTSLRSSDGHLAAAMNSSIHHSIHQPPIYTGWWLTYPSEKYEFVNGKDDIPYIMENEKCSKPPTSIYNM